MKMENLPVMGNITGVEEAFSRANSKQAYVAGRVCGRKGLAELINIRVSGILTRNKDTVYLLGRMETFTKVNF